MGQLIRCDPSVFLPAKFPTSSPFLEDFFLLLLPTVLLKARQHRERLIHTACKMDSHF